MTFDPLKEGAVRAFNPLEEGAVAVKKPNPVLAEEKAEKVWDTSVKEEIPLNKTNQSLSVIEKDANKKQAVGIGLGPLWDIDDDKRTMRANQMNADLFVSIHANAAASSAVQGIETYYTSPLLLRGSKSEDIAHSFMANREQKSKLLANCIQTNVLKYAPKRYGLVDRKVKDAIIQVLLGTDMPAALVEVGFLTNEIEAKRLANPTYQNSIAQGLFEGIRAYCVQNKLS